MVNISEIHEAGKSVFGQSKLAMKGFYETYYSIFSDKENGYWLKYTTVVPSKGTKIKPEAHVWFGYSDIKNPKNNFMVKQGFGLSKVKGSDRALGLLTIDKSELTVGRATGHIKTKKKEVSWSLLYPDKSFKEPYLYVPKWAEVFTTTIPLSIHPNLQDIVGMITIDGEKKEIYKAKGTLAKIVGEKYSTPWIWAHCNTFEGHPDAYLKLVYKPEENKGTIGFYDGKKLHQFAQTTLPIVNTGIPILGNHFKQMNHDELGVEFRAKHKAEISGIITLPEESLNRVQYQGPKGNKVICSNSTVSSVLVNLTIDGKTHSFEAKNSAAYESISTDPVPSKSGLWLPAERSDMIYHKI